MELRNTTFSYSFKRKSLETLRKSTFDDIVRNSHNWRVRSKYSNFATTKCPNEQIYARRLLAVGTYGMAGA